MRTFFLIVISFSVIACTKPSEPQPVVADAAKPTATAPAPAPSGNPVAGTPMGPVGAGGMTPVQPMNGGDGGYGAGQVMKEKAKGVAASAGGAQPDMSGQDQGN